MFRNRKKEREQFKTYYERKKNRKYSLWGSTKEAYGFILAMLIGWAPSFLLFYYAYALGPWWWILLLLYCACVSAAIYAVYRYREIVEIRGYFTDEEFEKVFKNELWLIRFMDKISRFLFN